MDDDIDETPTEAEKRYAEKLYHGMCMALYDAKSLLKENNSDKDGQKQDRINLAFTAIDDAHTTICGLMTSYYS